MKSSFVLLLLLLTLFLFHIFIAQPGMAGTSPEDSITKNISEWFYADKSGKLVYKTTPAGDKIMDFSYAGYMGGGIALPDVPVKRTVSPSGSMDDARLIQDAIDIVSAMPLENGFRGAVLLTSGAFTCSETLTISTSGVVLRGSGSKSGGTTIKMAGDRHAAITIRADRNRENERDNREAAFQTTITDTHVPSGAIQFTVYDASGFAVGDMISIQKPATEAWVKFMQMHDLIRNGNPQTWIGSGKIITERIITAISGNTITLDVPLSDSYDSKYLNPPGIAVAKLYPPKMIEQAGVEYIHIQAPSMEMSYEQAPYRAINIYGQDCWARDIFIEETMNSVNVGGRRITLERVVIDRTVPNLGAAKPAEFAPNGSQILLDRCASQGDNIFHVATGAGYSGPIVMLNCTFRGNGHAEGHQRWTTGILFDNCYIPEGGIDFMNRGVMGSGHGWGVGWAVAWNCVAKSYVVQQPPGTMNWMIGCTGENIPTPRPFDSGPPLPPGISDSPGKPVTPRSLYLTQLAERLGPQAVENIGYSLDSEEDYINKYLKPMPEIEPDIDKVLGVNKAFHKLANTSNVRDGSTWEFRGERTFDGDDATYWATDDAITEARLEVDTEGPIEINAIEIKEANGFENRVQEYRIEGQVDSDWKLLSQGKTIGGRKVDRFPKVTVWKVRILIVKANAYPAISEFGFYLDSEFKEK
ncbi:discoidin domain-containing protein [Candidatus Latescibacterota bacterium]